MKKFQDEVGREWEINLDCAAMARVFDICGVDLGDPSDGEIPLYARVLSGCGMLFKILPVICAGQIEVRGLTPQTFLEIIGIKNMPKIREAFIQEWMDFFRLAGQPSHAKAIDALAKLQAARAKLDPENPQLKKLEALLNTDSDQQLQDATT